jgi:hypothetical protein
MEESQVELHSQGTVIRRRILQQISPLLISLPKGSIAIRRMCEKFAAHRVTGTVSVTAHNRGYPKFVERAGPLDSVDQKTQKAIPIRFVL